MMPEKEKTQRQGRIVKWVLGIEAPADTMQMHI